MSGNKHCQELPAQLLAENAAPSPGRMVFTRTWPGSRRFQDVLRWRNKIRQKMTKYLGVLLHFFFQISLNSHKCFIKEWKWMNKNSNSLSLFWDSWLEERSWEWPCGYAMIIRPANSSFFSLKTSRHRAPFTSVSIVAPQ